MRLFDFITVKQTFKAILQLWVITSSSSFHSDLHNELWYFAG
jgi:hypothetical protein